MIRKISTNIFFVTTLILSVNVNASNVIFTSEPFHKIGEAPVRIGMTKPQVEQSLKSKDYEIEILNKIDDRILLSIRSEKEFLGHLLLKDEKLVLIKIALALGINSSEDGYHKLNRYIGELAASNELSLKIRYSTSAVANHITYIGKNNAIEVLSGTEMHKYLTNVFYLYFENKDYIY